MAFVVEILRRLRPGDPTPVDPEPPPVAPDPGVPGPSDPNPMPEPQPLADRQPDYWWLRGVAAARAPVRRREPR